MAKYDVECPVCGKSYTVAIFGKNRDREWKLQKWDWTCDECKARQRAKENEAAAEESKEMGLPDLHGSEKQVAWAESIRAKLVPGLLEEARNTAEKSEAANTDPVAIEAAQRHGFNSPKEVGLYAVQLAEEIAQIASASWWIENRAMKPAYELHSRLTDKRRLAERKKALADATPEAAEARAEATLAPEKPVTELVAEIGLTDELVFTSLPYRDDDFRQKVINLGFHWKTRTKRWERKISTMTGSSVARAAELAHNLLSIGFPVRVFNEEVRSLAIAASYEPEQKKWVKRCGSHPYDGWFMISWPREAGDFYQEAHRLPGARYDRPDVMVPAEVFDEVVDFAEVHGFALSPGAEKLVAEAKDVRDGALTVSVPDVEQTAETGPADRPTLDPADAGTVDADLIDRND